MPGYQITGNALYKPNIMYEYPQTRDIAIFILIQFSNELLTITVKVESGKVVYYNLNII
jgi:hypothetical protein